MPEFAAILPAAGSSKRFGDDKLQQPLGDSTVLEMSLSAFAQRRDVEIILVPTRSPELASAASGKILFCSGGDTRAQSVWNALKQVPRTIEWIAIHDAARPLVSQDQINRTFAAAQKYGAAVPAMSMNLTVKQAEGALPSVVAHTVPRQNLWTMQTPQIMRRADLLQAFEKCRLPFDQVTDDAQLLELIGQPVYLIPGEERNIKITTPLDLKFAQILLES